MPATDVNRLGDEASPYLRQHADNPVHWQPWDDPALEAARERDVPIFLSVGYAACHWCHVMEEESFQNPDIAAILNDHFVPIKVDREERPDLDRIYQAICQQVSGRGGWPLSVFLTPDRKPFYVGTYFPPESRGNVPGFGQLLRGIADSWADPEDRAEVEERAERWTAAVEREFEPAGTDAGVPGALGEADASGAVADPPNSDALVAAADAAVRGADHEHGGWGPGPKFPHPGRVRLLLRAADAGVDDPDAVRAVATETLDAMANRGLYDHLGGGFHRYATDRSWSVPHFEKMLYDNAELARLYVEAARAHDGSAGYDGSTVPDGSAASDADGETAVEDDHDGRRAGEPPRAERYRAVADETLTFLDRELGHPDGGFHATLDARSARPGADGDEADRVEGAFYLWTPRQVERALADAELDSAGEATESDDSGEITDASTLAELVCDRYGVTEPGNHEGRNTLRITRSVDYLASAYDLSPAAVRDRLAAARDALSAARRERPRPPRDEKVIAAWNGLAVSAFAEAGMDDRDRRERAEAALDFVRDRLWDGDRLARRWADGETTHEGYLDDYAFVARGAFDHYGAAADPDSLAFAIALARRIVDRFYDADAGTIHYATGDDLIARPAEVEDGSTPSSLGVAVDVLQSLDPFVDDDFDAVVADVLATHADRVRSSPVEHPSLVTTADRRARGDLELTLAADPIPDAWREALATHHLPRRLLAPRPPTDAGLDDWLDRLALDDAPPIWAGRAADDGPTAYACVDFACSPPMDDLDDALRWAKTADSSED